jgi:hypothetical protein
MSATDELVPFIDNGGRRCYIGRRRYTNLYRVPERRRSYRDRRTKVDRRRILNKKIKRRPERRGYFKD